MRILQVASTLDPKWGGPVECLRQLGLALEAMGHAVEVACLDAACEAWILAFPMVVHALGPGWGRYRFTKRWCPWLCSHAGRFDAVILHGIWQYHSYGSWRVLRRAGVPYVIYPHGALDPWFATAYPLKHLKKTVYWRWAESFVLRDALSVLFTSEAERVLSRQSFRPGSRNEEVTGLGTFSPPQEKHQQESFSYLVPEARNKRVILYLGRLHPRKGCDLAVQAFSRVLGQSGEWHLVVAGPDEVGWKRRLQARADEYGAAAHITFIDMLGNAAKWRALRRAECLFLPSHGENFGVSVAEALACGTPVLISDQVAICREVATWGAGLVASDSVEGACDLLRRWQSTSVQQRSAMATQARRCFEECFEIAAVARKVSDVLEAAYRSPYRPVSADLVPRD